MELPHIKIKKLDPKAKVPQLGSLEAAGLDLFTLESAEIPSGQRALLRTGIAMAIPAGMAGFIWPRSKLASKKGIAVLAGLVDPDYRGEVMISLHNTSDSVVEFRAGDKCAQMVIQQHFSWLPLEIVDELAPSDRGEEGINSHSMRLN
jgi:dUTP pyrophosphatase